MKKLKDVKIHETMHTDMGGIRVSAPVISNETIDSGTLSECVGLNSTNTVVRGESADGGMQNPMTAANDIIVGGSSGAPTRLAAGTEGQILKVTSEGVAWGDVPSPTQSAISTIQTQQTSTLEELFGTTSGGFLDLGGYKKGLYLVVHYVAGPPYNYDILLYGFDGKAYSASGSYSTVFSTVVFSEVQ